MVLWFSVQRKVDFDFEKGSTATRTPEIMTFRVGVAGVIHVALHMVVGGST